MNTKVLKDPKIIKLAVAGVVFIAAMVWLVLHIRDFFGPPPNRVVAFYKYTRMSNRIQRPPGFRRTGRPTTPPDPRMIYEFAGRYYRLQLIKRPEDPKINMMIDELPPRGNGDWRRQDPKWLHTVESISDPVQQALTFAAMRGPRAVRFWLISCGADSAAISQAKLAASSFIAARDLLRTQEHEGLVHPRLLHKIEQHLAVFMKMQGDPVTNSARQHMARRIYREGNEFYDELEARRMKYTRRYVEAVESVLPSKVKTEITRRIERILSRFHQN